MNDRIQLSFAQAPATTNQNGSFRFTDTRAERHRLCAGQRHARACSTTTPSSATSRTRSGWRWPTTVYAQDSWKPTRDLTLELGLRYSLWQPWGTTNQAMASFQSQFYDPATRAGDRSGRRASSSSGDRFNGIVAAGRRARPTRRSRTFPQLANLQRLYHGVPNGFSETPKDGLQPRLGHGLRHQRAHDVPRRRRPVPEPRADQHDRGLRLQPAALGDADGDQRHRRRARRRRRRATSRW